MPSIRRTAMLTSAARSPFALTLALAISLKPECPAA
jgi:hypothetical protein